AGFTIVISRESIMSDLQSTIEAAFENRANITPANVDPTVKEAVFSVLEQLNDGRLRVATRKVDSQEWETHQWIKKAVLLSFRLEDDALMDDGVTKYFDKVPPKFADNTEADFKAGGFRVVRNAIVRRGSYVAKNAEQMPSYGNNRAYVGEGTMVDN